MKERLNNYDLLRTCSIIAVVFIHVNYSCYFFYNGNPNFSSSYFFESFINIITRFSVPCFFMLSGAFNLSKEKNSNFIAFYKRKFFQIVVPFLVINTFFGIAKLIYKGFDEININTIYEFYKNGYIEILIFLYLLTPIIIIIKNKINKKTGFGIIFVLFIWSIFSSFTSNYEFNFAIGSVFEFLSYYLFGNFIFEKYKNGTKFISKKIFPVLIFGCFVCIFSLLIIVYKLNIFDMISPLKVFLNPFIVVYSILVFVIFSNINVKIKTYGISNKSLYIFLIHFFIISFASKFVQHFISNSFINIFLISILVFIIYLLCAVIYQKIEKLIKMGGNKLEL